MSIGFESPEIQLRKLRERLQQMSDEELIHFGRTHRRLKASRVAFPIQSINSQRRERNGDAGIRGLPASMSQVTWPGDHWSRTFAGMGVIGKC